MSHCAFRKERMQRGWYQRRSSGDPPDIRRRDLHNSAPGSTDISLFFFLPWNDWICLFVNLNTQVHSSTVKPSKRVSEPFVFAVVGARIGEYTDTLREYLLRLQRAKNNRTFGVICFDFLRCANKECECSYIPECVKGILKGLLLH